MELSAPAGAALADIHCTSTDSSWVGSPITGDARHSLNYVTQWCRDHDIPCFLLGDVLDRTSNRSATLAAVRGSVAEGAEVFAIEGNHDADTPPWLPLIGIPMLDGRIIELRGGLKVTGMSYKSAAELPAALAATCQPGIDILLAHQGWEEWMGGHSSQGTLRSVPNVSYVISGDNHKTISEVITTEDGREMVAISPGSSSMQDTSEADEHYFAVIREDGTVTFEPIPSRPILRVPLIDTPDELREWASTLNTVIASMYEDAKAQMPEEVARPLVIAKVRVACAAAWETIREGLIAAGAHVKHEYVSVDASDFVPESMEIDAQGPVGLLPLFIPQSDTVTFTAASRILETAMKGDDIASTVSDVLDAICIATEDEPIAV